MDCALIFDVGTTAVKAALYTRELTLLALETEEYALLTSPGGRVEFIAEDYWRAALRAAGRIAACHPREWRCVQAVAVTTQGETLIPVNAAGEALHKAVVWLDGRAEAQAETVRRQVSAEVFYQTTGIPECNGYCPIAKLLWFREQEPQVYAKARYFLLLEDYLLFRLTGRFCTERSLLSTTGYYDIERDCVWSELLQALGLNERQIPPAMECGECVAYTTSAATAALGLAAPAMAITGAMDQVAGAIGAGNFRPGLLTETTGTALCVGATLERRALPAGGGVPIYRHYLKRYLLALPVCMTAGMTLKWFKDVFCERERRRAEESGQNVYSLLSELARQAPPLSGGLLMLPFLSGSLQPEALPDGSGAFLGVGLHTDRNCFLRAIMEGVAYMLKDNLRVLEEWLDVRFSEIRALGGGAKSSLWNEMKACVCDRPVLTMANEECATAGTAMLCAVAMHWEESVESAAGKANASRQTVLPDAALAQTYQQGYARFRDACGLLAAWSAKEVNG